MNKTHDIKNIIDNLTKYLAKILRLVGEKRKAYRAVLNKDPNKSRHTKVMG